MKLELFLSKRGAGFAFRIFTKSQEVIGLCASILATAQRAARNSSDAFY
jgi:hypothetical protein